MAENENTICVIEDNVPNRKLFATLLKRAGFQVIEFGDGKTSTAWLKDNQPSGILIDILLPDTNGSDIVKYIRTLPYGKTVPAIAVTGFGQNNDMDKFISHGFDGVIPKPVNTTTFVSEIQEIMKQRQTAA